MPPVNVDLSESERAPLPAGSVVRVRVEGGKEQESQKGTKYMAWTLIVTDPPEPGDNPARKLFENTMLTGAGAFRTAQFLRALGVPFGKERPDLNGGFDDMECHGRECRALLDIEKDDVYGEKNVVKKFMAL